jgi:hypothetical protein
LPVTGCQHRLVAVLAQPSQLVEDHDEPRTHPPSVVDNVSCLGVIPVSRRCQFFDPPGNRKGVTDPTSAPTLKGAATDPALAAKIWAISEKQTGIDPAHSNVAELSTAN